MKKHPLIDFTKKEETKSFYGILKSSSSGRELLGLCQGIVADGIVTIGESEYLVNWINQAEKAFNNYYVKAIACRLKEFVNEGYVSSEEREDLFQTLQALSNAKKVPSGKIFKKSISFSDNSFTSNYNKKNLCITGRCILGPRNKCKNIITSQGGIFCKTLSKKTDVLIVGSLTSHTSSNEFGSKKIEKAINLKNNGHHLEIISEERWLKDIFK